MWLGITCVYNLTTKVHCLQKPVHVPWLGITDHLQVSVSSRHLPHLNSFQVSLLPHGNVDIFVPVSAVTLGLGWALWSTGTA